jgi:cobalt transporter subunit CbtB
MTMQNQASTADTLRTESKSTTIPKALQLAAAFLLGTVILYGAGFMNSAVMHNAAHDIRHSQGFPCH